MTKLRIFLFLFLLLNMFVPGYRVSADTGPKPTMEFTFRQESDLLPMSISSGILYECDQADCSDATPLEQVGPQGLYCDTESCHATAYGFAPYHRLEIEFSGGVTRESNVFSTASFDSKYTVTVRPDDLLVEPQFSVVPSFSLGASGILACVCASLGVGLVGGIVIFVIRRSKKN